MRDRAPEPRKHALRGTVIELCGGAGALAGFLWMVDTLDTKPVSCGKRQELGECAAQGLIDQLVPAVMKPAGLGLVGLLLGLAVSLMVPGLKARDA